MPRLARVVRLIRSMLLTVLAVAQALSAAAAVAAQESPLSSLPASRGRPAPQPDPAILVAAHKEVALAEEQYGPTALQLVNPLLKLAATQRGLRDYYGAKKNYLRAAAIVETQPVADSHELIAALSGIATIYSENGDHESAAQMLERAIDISRKVYGVLNPQQLDMMKSLIETRLALGDYEGVVREQQLALRIAESAYAKDTPRLVEALECNAGWFESLGRYSTAREMHARALLMASNLGKEKTLMMIEPLRGVARAHRLEFLHGPETPVVGANGSSSYSHPSREGEAALKLAVEILDAQPECDAAERGRAQLDLGDWRMFAGHTDQALEAYREAWAALSAPGAGGTAAFDAPVQIYYRPPSGTRRPTVAPDRFAERSAEVEFTVAADGHVRAATLATSEVPEKTGRLLVRAVKGARYRPRFVAGTAVETTGVKYRETIYIPK